MGRRTTIRSPGMRAIVATLVEHGPLDAYLIASLTDLSPKTVKKHAQVLHELGRIHISGWIHNKSGPDTAIWKAGKGIDAKRTPRPYPLDPMDCLLSPRIDQITAALMGLSA